MTDLNGVILKCQWLEDKCNKYISEISSLQKQLQMLEKIAGDREAPEKMYYNEVEFWTDSFNKVLGQYNDNYNKLMFLHTPTSYNELRDTLNNIQKYFNEYTKELTNYYKYIDGLTSKSPIFLKLSKELIDNIHTKNNKIEEKFDNYIKLLNNPIWTCDLDDISNDTLIKTIAWFTKAKKLLDTLDIQFLGKVV